jgi:putative YphP/YqiW family bacilliredoxin
MRAELSRLGVIELRDAAAVDAAFNTPGTMVLVVNSVCGCAAANARPAIGLATQAEHQPDQYVTVFAGQDMEATARARELMPGIPPSSPFIALLKDGDPVYVIERRHIEGRSASAIATDLEGATGEGHPSSPAAMPSHGNGLPPTFRSIR